MPQGSRLTEPLGLRVQILVGLGVVTGFAMLSTGYLALWAAGESVVGQREATARAVSSGLAGAVSAVLDSTRPIVAPDNQARLTMAMRGLEGQSDLVGFEVFGPDRRSVLARPAGAPPTPDEPVLAGVLNGIGPVLHYRARAANGGTELDAYAPIVGHGKVMGAVRVALEAPQPLATVLGRSGWVLLVLAGVDALLVVGLGYLVLTRLVVRPLRAMQMATARVSAGQWDQRIDIRGSREVAGLADALNQMTASLNIQREQLIRNEKLASVGQLAAGVAHEIGNPLAAVLGYADILRSDAAADGKPLLGPAERRDALDRVKAETQRIHRIIQDLLAYSRPAKDEAQPTEPLEILRSVEALLAPQARFRGVKVVLDNAPVASVIGWPRVMVSPSRFKQVVVNLLLNAADAMNGRGVVTVGCVRVGATVQLSVGDQGTGVSAELQRRIFDPFFTTKAPGQGTGLGLSVSRSIIESYRGTLELHPSTPESPGATFVITLPSA